jgi:hypothetical protein
MLDSEVVVCADEAAASFPGASGDARGRGRSQPSGRRRRRGNIGLVDGAVCGVVAPLGRLLMVLRFTIARGKIVETEAIADPERLRRFQITLLDD